MNPFNPNRRKIDFCIGTLGLLLISLSSLTLSFLFLALYNDVTRGDDHSLFDLNSLFSMNFLEAVLTRFDKYIGPILINMFSKITHLDVMKEWSANSTKRRPVYTGDQSVCARVFADNKSFDQESLKHSYPNLYQ